MLNSTMRLETCTCGSYFGGSYNAWVSNLDTTVSHRLEATMYRDGVLDYWTYSVDGVESSQMKSDTFAIFVCQMVLAMLKVHD